MWCPSEAREKGSSRTCVKSFRLVHNGSHTAPRVELGDTIVVETAPTVVPERSSGELEFEVVGILGEAESETQYAICYCQSADTFVVADAFGRLLADEALAQEVLDDFLAHAEDAPAEDPP